MPYYPISKVYTVKDVISSARELSRATSVDDILNYQEKLIYKISLFELYNLLVSAGRRDYVTSITAKLGVPTYDDDIGGIFTEMRIYQNGIREIVIDTRLILDPGVEMFLRYNTILELAGRFQFIKKEYSDYLQILHSEFKASGYKNSAVWAVKDDKIYIQFGIETNPPSQNGVEVCDVIFNRLPIIPSNDTEWNNDYVDLPDAYIPALFHRLASLMLYQKSGVLLEPSLKFLDVFYQSTLVGLRLEDEAIRSRLLESLTNKSKSQRVQE